MPKLLHYFGRECSQVATEGMAHNHQIGFGSPRIIQFEFGELPYRHHSYDRRVAA